MRVIAICNQKGGVGKTTTAWAILTGAALRGRRVLGIDYDPQGSLSYIMGAEMGQKRQKTAAGDFLPASLDILSLEDVDALKRAIAARKRDYDLVVIDAPPSLGKPQLATLRAATEVLIPLQADPLSVQGLYTMKESIAAANPDLTFTGAFLARYNGRSVLARNMTDAIRERCKQLQIAFIDTPIREGVAIREAQLLHEPIYTYSPRSNPAKDYAAFLDAIKI